MSEWMMMSNRYLPHVRRSRLQSYRTWKVVWKLENMKLTTLEPESGPGLHQNQVWIRIRPGLEQNPGSSHLKEEGESVVSELPQELLLHLGVGQLLFVLELRVNLPGHQKQVPPEGYTHHIHVLAAVPKRTGQHHED